MKNKRFSGILIATFLTLSVQTAQSPSIAANPLGLVKQLAGGNKGQGQEAKTSPPLKAIVPRDKWAVTIGIGRFRDSSVKPIKFAATNAAELADLLREPMVGRFAADHVISLTDKGATKAAIEANLTEGWLFKKALPEDLIAIYVCTRASLSPDGKDVFILASDSGERMGDEKISLRKLLSDICKRTQSRYIVAFIDLFPVEANEPFAASRNDGKSAKSSEGGVSAASWQEIADETGVTLLCANAPGEGSHESGEAEASFFAHYLGMGLSAFGGSLPLVTIAEYVIKNVEHDVMEKLKSNQLPRLAVAGRGVDVSGLQIGIPVKSSTQPKGLAIGHPEEKLSTRRPDLLPAARQKAASAPSQPKTEQPEREHKVGDVDFGTYMSKMKRQIQNKWTPPKGMEERKVVAVFTIMKDGQIVDPSLVESSGVDSVDKAAMTALKQSSPLEPLPEGAPEYVQIRYKFDYKVKRN